MLDGLKDIARPYYRRLRWLACRILGLVPSLPVKRGVSGLKRLGTGYGGWTFLDHPDLRSSTVVCCGLGEDGSFDVEFAAAYQATVIIVDPTPRAIEHYNGIIARAGQPSREPYTTEGPQRLAAYDLAGVSAGQLQLCDRALWNCETTLRFFAPSNPDHVSHSIVNFQNQYSTDTSHMEVQTITMEQLLRRFGVSRLGLLKLDIEGAEIEVLLDMMSKGVLPDQILVEFDELSVPSRRSRQRVGSAHLALVRAGYELVHREQINFTYVQRQLLAPVAGP